MSRVLSPDRRPGVRPFVIAAVAIAVLPVPSNAQTQQKPGYDATQVWQDWVLSWLPPIPVDAVPSPEPLPAPMPKSAPPTAPAPEPALPPAPDGTSTPTKPPLADPAAFDPPAPPATGIATVSWDAPTQRIDDSPLENLAGFRVYYGTAAGAYTSKLEVNAPSLTSVVISSLPEGTYWFVVTAYDAEGIESVYSEAASKYVSS
jgi:hypothetical protein